MFGFLKLQSTLDDDPLQKPATASAWLRRLPPQDVARRLRQVLIALENVRGMSGNVDRDRIAAIEFADAALDADRRRLIAQYVTSVDRSAAIADHIWQSMHEMNEGFIHAYQAALEAALARPRSASYQLLIPQLLARLIRCFGIDGKLRAFRHQRWIPAKWRELHQLYRQAQERGIERMPLARDDPPSETRYAAIEQEYLCVLLTDRIDTGNLSPADFNAVSEWLRDWSGELALDAAPRSAGGFVLDIEGKTGLTRRTGTECGAAMRFVDTTSLVLRFQCEIAALTRPRLASREPVERERQRHIAILEKAWPALAPTLAFELRRHPRNPVAVHAAIRVGMAHFYDALAADDEAARTGDRRPTAVTPHYRHSPAEVHGNGAQVAATMAHAMANVEQIEVHAVAQWADDAELWIGAGDTTAHGAHEAPSTWTIVDRSATGLRLRAPAGDGQSLAVGTLVGIRPFPASAWMLCAVRRVCRLSNDIVEAGVSILADRVVAATLHKQCAGRDDMRFVVDGIDVSTMGAIFRGLYVPPKTQSNSASSGAALIVATSNYDIGRRVVLAAGDEVHTLVLRQPIEQHADWTWTTIEVASRSQQIAK